MSSVTKQLIFVVFGIQGSGKGTQVQKIAEKYGLTIVEAGEILRHEAQTDPQIHQYVTSGALVPGEVIGELIAGYVNSHRNHRGYVFDGYPRNLEQCQHFKQLVDLHDWQPIAIQITLSEETAMERIANRFTLVDGKKVVREDDTPEVVQRRLLHFKTDTLPIKAWFKEHYRVLEVDGEPSIEVVTRTLLDKIRQLHVK